MWNRILGLYNITSERVKYCQLTKCTCFALLKNVAQIITCIEYLIISKHNSDHCLYILSTCIFYKYIYIIYVLRIYREHRLSIFFNAFIFIFSLSIYITVCMCVCVGVYMILISQNYPATPQQRKDQNLKPSLCDPRTDCL